MREYVYAPSGAAGGWTGTAAGWSVDEQICQIDRCGGTAWVVQDVTGDVVALVEPEGVIAAQYTYGPYGEILARDQVTPYRESRAGHKGLFYERLDIPSVNALTLAPLSRGIYHCRNRSYDPYGGRFLQRDPNATGQVVAGVGYHASLPMAGLVQPGLKQLFTDGMSADGALRSRPLRLSDPSGLLGIPDQPAPIGFGLAIATNAARISFGVLSSIKLKLATLGILTATQLKGSQSTSVTRTGPQGPPPPPRRTVQQHHIATDKHTYWTPKFREVFASHGIDSLNDPLNLVPVPGHMGPHPEVYHETVWDRLTGAALDGGTGGFFRELSILRMEVNDPQSELYYLVRIPGKY